MTTRISAFLSVFLLLSAGAVPQSRSSSQKRSPGSSLFAYKLIALKVTGTNRYTPEALAAASGLEIGQNVNEENFKEATQKLGATGLFTDIAYSYSFSPAGTKLELQVTENKQLIPIRFDNFAWYSDQELIDKVRASVPLFQGEVPVGGGLVDQVADVIDSLLVQRNPQFHVKYLRATESENGGPIQDVVFSVTGAQFRIRNVEFPGASPSQIGALAAAARKLRDADYQRSGLALFAKFDAQPIYQKQGFLRARFEQAHPQVVSDTPEETVVDIKLPVVEGQQYKFKAVEWTGNSAFPADKLQTLIHAQSNAPMNGIQLDQDLEAVRRLYGTRGYMKARVQPEPRFDDAVNTVAYIIEIKEGDQYKMGDVDFEGLDEKTVARLREDWKLREGEPYDSSYPLRFFKESSADLPHTSGWTLAVHESVNDKEKTVDVGLKFAPKEH
jgi:outer membrane protein assembly factor BamA